MILPNYQKAEHALQIFPKFTYLGQGQVETKGAQINLQYTY